MLKAGITEGSTTANPMPITPPANAEEVLAGLPNARHLVITGASRDLAFTLGAEAAVLFLLGKPLPPPPANPFSFEPLPTAP